MKHLLKNIENTRQGFESLAALAKTGIGLLGDKLVLDLSGCSFFAANMAAHVEINTSDGSAYRLSTDPSPDNIF